MNIRMFSGIAQYDCKQQSEGNSYEHYPSKFVEVKGNLVRKKPLQLMRENRDKCFC